MSIPSLDVVKINMFLLYIILIANFRQKSGIVHKIRCTKCNFVFHGQTERSLKTRIVEHKKAVARPEL